MPAKTPMYLKTTTPKRGKKLRLRDVLSGDMISPPLGDVRHSAHVGPEGEGDMFGDVGFLQGKMDMLPSLNRAQNGHGRSHSMERHLDEGLSANQNSYSYNSHLYHNPSTGLLKTTISLPVFIAHEQAPPKPPRLHLDEPSSPPLASQFQLNQLLQGRQQQMTQPNNHTQNYTSQTQHLNQNNTHNQTSNYTQSGYSHISSCSQQQQQQAQQHRSLSLCENGTVDRLASDPCRDISYSPAIRRLVPSSGSFSEVSSEDSTSETCGPADPRQGLSLDSDAGLSNEDLRSERSESPCTPLHAAGLMVSSSPSAVSRSDSMAGLNLDLGPSILEDVLGIMDRYRTVDDRYEL